MPPDDKEKLPTEEEGRGFADWIEQIKDLSLKDPGPYVIRCLNKVKLANTLHNVQFGFFLIIFIPLLLSHF